MEEIELLISAQRASTAQTVENSGQIKLQNFVRKTKQEKKNHFSFYNITTFYNGFLALHPGGSKLWHPTAYTFPSQCVSCWSCSRVLIARVKPSV